MASKALAGGAVGCGSLLCHKNEKKIFDTNDYQGLMEDQKRNKENVFKQTVQ